MTPEQRKLVGSYQRVFKSDDGKAVLDHLKKIAHVNESHFLDGTDLNLLMRNETRRSLVLAIIAKVEMKLDTRTTETAINEGTE